VLFVFYDKDTIRLSYLQQLIAVLLFKFLDVTGYNFVTLVKVLVLKCLL